MIVLDSLRSALAALFANSLRSVLTALGIIIGVGSVIVMVAVGSGARFEVNKQISSLGTNLLVVNPSARLFGGRSSGAGSNLPLSEDDLRAIETKVAGVVAISGQLWASATVVYGNANFWTRIWGVHARYLAACSWSVEFWPRDYRARYYREPACSARWRDGGQETIRRQRSGQRGLPDT